MQTEPSDKQLSDAFKSGTCGKPVHVGMRLSIVAGDHNIRFEAELPLSGVVESHPRCEGSRLDWYVLKLDKPFDEKGQQITRLLIASRWNGHQLGRDATSVYVIYVPPEMDSVPDGFPVSLEIVAAWGNVPPAVE